MKRFQRLTNSFRFIIVIPMLIFLLIPLMVFAEPYQEIIPFIDSGENLLADLDEPVAEGQSEIAAPTAITPTLEIDILGTPYAPYDFNTINRPEVFVVHAQVVNTGTITAMNVALNLDFNDSLGTGWVLLDGEVEDRSIDELNPGDVFNAYWFVVYPMLEGATHLYTVTLTADDFDPIAAVGTVEVVKALDTSNAYQISSDMDVDIGGDFSITITYYLGRKHFTASFNPVGNADFLPGNYRLVSTTADFFDLNQSLMDSFMDKLFFLSLKPEYETVTVRYDFIELSPAYVRLCPYTLVEKIPHKYDKQFCSGDSILAFPTITGYVYFDENGNGIFDPTEIGIAGVTITLDDLYSTVTDINGAYTFTSLVSGTHKVVETDLAGYFSTTPNEVHPYVEAGAPTQVNFGDALIGVNEFASIYGTVFHDTNHNGLWDDDETGISGVTITLDDSIVTTTDMFGAYTYSTIVIGDHTVVETDPFMHISTTPNTVVVEGVTWGEGYLVNFGDKYLEKGIFLPIILR